MIKIISIGSFLLISFLNLIQETFKLFNTPELNGSFEVSERIPFSINNWITGDFQSSCEKSISYNFGISNRLIRYKNCIDYNLFDKANAKEVIVGKNDFLYEINYINAYTGMDCLGRDSINLITSKLEVIQDSLKKRNINLLLIFSPGKATIYPEHIPDRFINSAIKDNNLKLFHSYAKQHNLNFLDLTDFFLRAKDTCHYPLFVNTGTHWTEYGDALVTIELNNYLKNSLNYAQNKVFITHYVTSDSARGRDADIAEGLNLPFQLRTPKLMYPNLGSEKSEKPLPNSIVIGDSYFWGIFAKGYSSLLFNSCEFWYYNRIIHNNKNTLTENANTSNLTEKLKSTQLIVIIATEATLKKFGWGIVNRLFHYVSHPEIEQKTIREYNANVQKWRKYILTDKNWIRDAEKRAKEKNISLDSAITLDAMYQVEIKNNTPNP